jgi:hypothetical protein
MREESSAPRNSRELAVRNQFFTPRYVVEFLTDNTLGRTWYEMTKGQTVLKEQCRYLVRRPTEIFLKPGDSAPEEAKSADNLSQEELLRQPVHIPHRPLKDPREIRLLDPACGSMHFGLYAFDLFTVIYDEAWEIAHSVEDAAKSAETFAPFVTFAAGFPDKVAFLREVPRLIVEHNIHGIDIDPRAAQIAGLSLWLRAQRAWHQAGVKPADRPRITRSNLVCAEPMPGEKELLREFVEQQFPAGERPAFAFLLETVFDRMTLAGEAGSLLRIEEEIRAAIAEAKRLWKAGPKHEQATLFPEAEATSGQGEMRLDLSGITDEQFWERAEQRIYDALEAYAEQAEDGGGFQRRLFADDAAQGFAFIDLCRKRYDVVVMNPPFGGFSKLWTVQSKTAYPNSYNDILGAFVERFLFCLNPRGRLGAITARTCFFLSSFSKWRREIIQRHAALTVAADLGHGVMDDAMVDAAAYVIERSTPQKRTPFLRAIAESDRKQALEEMIGRYHEGNIDHRVFVADQDDFSLLGNSQFVYWVSRPILEKFASLPLFKDAVGDVRQGLATADNPRFVRTLWEIPPNYRLGQEGDCWAPYVLAGASQPWFSPITLVVNWRKNAGELWNNLTTKGTVRSNIWMLEEIIRLHFFKPGFSWTRRAPRFIPYVIPQGCIPSASRYIAIPAAGMLNKAVGVCASRVGSSFLRFFGEVFERPNYLVGDLKQFPWPPLPNIAEEYFAGLIKQQVEQRRMCYRNQEPYSEFLIPSLVRDFTDAGRGLNYNMDQFLDAAGENLVATAFGFDEREVKQVERDLREALQYIGRTSGLAQANDDGEEASSEDVLDFSDRANFAALISYCVGTAFGRWDIRYATGARPEPELPDPFAPMPLCPPGMLQGDDGLPLSPEAGRRLRTEGRYPLDVAWDGILVDDLEHPLDLERRVHAALAVLWGDRADALEHEACALLGTPSLREWFRRPGGFFADHLKRYSKSRRQAPIYWPLSTASGRYTLWIYYHRLTDQTLHTAIADFIDPKLRSLDHEISAQREKSSSGGSKLAELLEFRGELLDLKAELERIIKLPWKPNLNDGVLITACPLWKLFRFPKWQKDLKTCWQELEKGDYDWAHLAYSIWPKRVEKVCETDRSIAIAHGLEHLCKVEPPKPKKERKAKQPKAETPDGLLAGLEEAGTAAKSAPRSTPSEISITPRSAPQKQEAPIAGDAPKIDIEDTDRNEVMCCIRQLFGEGGARDRETALKQLSLSLGYQRLGTKVREILERDLLTAVRRRILINNGGHLQLATGGLDAVDRDELKDGFLAAIGRSWIDREEAARSFARFLGYARTGPALEDTARSLMNGLIRDGRLESDGPNLRRT